MARVLFAASEVYPFIKTGGLADVAGSLPAALQALDQDLVVILPAYGAVRSRYPSLRSLSRLHVGGRDVEIQEVLTEDSAVPVWLVDCPALFDRPGNPYVAEDGQPWSDNAQRFALFCRVLVEICQGRAGLDWQPQLLHCNDWQTGLAPALLSLEAARPATVFTIHNLAYQGLFSRTVFDALLLPEVLWSIHALEFHGQLSFIKGGLVYADRITTVSPTYAREIQTSAFGYGLEGLLHHRAAHLCGILNGIDMEDWNPETDPHLEDHYHVRDIGGKYHNKRALQQKFQLPVLARTPLIGSIGRLVEQKGIDLILDLLPELAQENVQIILLGTGERSYEKALQQLARKHPDRLSVHIGYNESLAHLIEAGSDLFLMPSRFEPCGLNQMYSLRYGTLPIVRNTGGLADTVVDASQENIEALVANGFVFDEDNPQALRSAIDRALALYPDRRLWIKLMLVGMWGDFSWERSAQQYLDLYDQIIT